MSKQKKIRMVSTTLAPSGILGADQCETFADSLSKALAKAGPIVVDLSEVTDCGTMALQVIYAASKSAQSRALKFTVKGRLWKQKCEQIGLALGKSRVA